MASVKTQFKKGQIPWNKGLTREMDNRIPQPWLGKNISIELKEKLRILASERIGEKHPNWKGDKVSYRSLHKWVERNLGKAFRCMINEAHKSTRYHWANISKEYKRDLSDWMMMCPSCNCRDRIGRRVSP